MVDGINGNGNSANANANTNSANGNGNSTNGNGANTKSYLMVVSAKYWWCSLSSSVVFD